MDRSLPRRVLEGTELTNNSDRVDLGILNPMTVISLSIYLRPRTNAVDQADKRLDRDTLAEIRGADPSDVEAVRNFLGSYGIAIPEVDLQRRRLLVQGPARSINAAFEVEIHSYQLGEINHIGHDTPLTVPSEMSEILIAILGTETAPIAHSHLRTQISPGPGYLPTEVAQAYGFPTTQLGDGQVVGLIELGGGFVEADLTTYFGALGTPTPKVQSISIDGATNAPTGTPNSADGEVMLDIEVVGSIVPNAQIMVFFAPNTNQGFVDAISHAVHSALPMPSVVSISWGGPEEGYPQSAIAAFEAQFNDASALGITFLAAAGDNGSSDGVNDGQPHVDYPAASPWVLGCGGTRLEIQGGARVTETVWNDLPNGGATGGGVSAAFGVPSWQSKIPIPNNRLGSPGRGVPDVSGDADPQTGYRVRVDGTDTIFGGTSAVAPLWAAFLIKCNQHRGSTVGFVNPLLYGAPSGDFFDITSGSNGTYNASVGWDPCSGLGSPAGQALFNLLG